MAEGGRRPGAEERRRAALRKVDEWRRGWDAVAKHVRELELDPHDPDDRETLIEVAGIAARQDSQATARNIRFFRPDIWPDRRTVVEIAKTCASRDGAATAEHIKEFCLDPEADKEELVEIAKLCAGNRARMVRHLQNFGFDSRADRGTIIEIAKLCARQNARITGLEFWRFGLNPGMDKEAVIEVARVCAQHSAWGTVMHFDGFFLDPADGPLDREAVIEIASICARREGHLTAKCFRKFRLDPRVDRAAVLEIARLCAVQNPEGTLARFDEFGLGFDQDQARRFCFDAERAQTQETARGMGRLSALHKLSRAAEAMGAVDSAFRDLDLTGLAVGTQSYVKATLLAEALDAPALSTETVDRLRDTVVPALRAVEGLGRPYPTLGLEQGRCMYPFDDRDRLTLKGKAADYLAGVKTPHALQRSETTDGGFVLVRILPTTYPVFVLLARKLTELGVLDSTFYSGTVLGRYRDEIPFLLAVLFFADRPVGAIPPLTEAGSPEGVGFSHGIDPWRGTLAAGPDWEPGRSPDPPARTPGGKRRGGGSPRGGRARSPESPRRRSHKGISITQFLHALTPGCMEGDLRRTFVLASAAAAHLGICGMDDEELARLYLAFRDEARSFLADRSGVPREALAKLFPAGPIGLDAMYYGRKKSFGPLEAVARRLREDDRPGGGGAGSGAALHQEFKDMTDAHVERMERRLFAGRLKRLVDLALGEDFAAIRDELLMTCFDADPAVRARARELARDAYPVEYAKIARDV